jgi:hypothetical protein
MEGQTMDDRPEIEVRLYGFIEALLLRAIAQESLLDLLTAEEDNWREQLERAQILNAPQIRAHFAELLDKTYGVSTSDPPPEDWNAIVDEMFRDIQNGGQPPPLGLGGSIL